MVSSGPTCCKVQMPGAQRVGTNLTQVTGEAEDDDDPNRLPTFVKAGDFELGPAEDQ